MNISTTAPKEEKYPGLSRQQAQKNLQEFGRNEIIKKTKNSAFRILLRQFTSPLILLLLAAALVSLLIDFIPEQQSHVVDAILIFIIVLISAALGFWQDYHAEKTIETLQKMSVPRSRVLRDGQQVSINSWEVVPGDLLLLESGDMVTADGKVLQSFHLEMDESVLTGESATVRKEKEDLLCMNTYVTGGHAEVMVTETGMRTKIGQVAATLQELEKEKSSFQIELALLSKWLSGITLIILLIVAFVGVFKFGFYTAILTAISLAVAAIPEGLPAVVVLALVAGAKEMFRKHALIRRLTTVESIGAVNIICTDKTGTLTLNEMAVTTVYYDGKSRKLEDIKEEISSDPVGRLLFLCGTLCNNAQIGINKDGKPHFYGEQTEVALKEAGIHILSEKIYNQYVKRNELSFNSQRKMMSVMVEEPPGKYTIFSKGAPEVLLEKCTHIYWEGEVISLEQAHKEDILNQNNAMATKALRVLGFAFKPANDIQRLQEEELTWIGLQAMMDPPRPEVSQAIRDCQSAGIRVIMITGDNPVTAKAIADQIGLETQEVLDGISIESMDDTRLKAKLDAQVNIFARTNPFHKLRLLEILEKGNSVAMTGDGVNDALAIKKAEVGIAMGKKATEVAKQASDLILLDDNFITIRDAVKEGRTIFNNIRKFINYLLTCNLAEVLVIFFSMLFLTLNEPLLFPIQLLWVNLLTDGLVALALGVDPASEDIMQHKPRRDKAPIINRRLSWLIGLIGIQMTLILLGILLIVYPLGLDTARSVLLTAIVFFNFVRIVVIRSQEQMAWTANPWLVGSLVLSIGLHLIVLYSPLNTYFYLIPLNIYAWLVILGGMLTGFLLAVYTTKMVVKWIPE
ncbi:cation-transporting P-type ATPase [Catalinimonas sp. 4WD22]|uniref:cation-translocating P-type ATPase n=1 Tax=Catalinimonas locisalis TaxID=3133978 RepID=UPI003101A480